MSHASPLTLDRDHARPRTAPAPPCPAVEERLSTLLRPALDACAADYQALGLRGRILTLPIMTALLLALVWRQVSSVTDLVRLAAREPVLWAPPLQITQQALSLRLRQFPHTLVFQVFTDLLPTLHARARARSRPQPAVIARAQQTFAHVWIVDATTLEALFHKVGVWRGTRQRVWGGTLLALLDLPSHLPVQLWLDPDGAANEKRFRPVLEAAVGADTLLLLDAGFWCFELFDALCESRTTFLLPFRAKTAFRVKAVLNETGGVRDRLIQVGLYRSNRCRHPLRLGELWDGTSWRGYLTNALDPQVLPPPDVAALYAYRWRIEEAFLVTKRLLNLSYLPAGAFNAVALQVWTTWLLYAVLLDLCDAVAEELAVPLERISVELVYRGLYHFQRAYERGEAADPVAYFSAPAQRDLGVLKRVRRKPPTGLAPTPEALTCA
jgi:hypothetical protein